MSENMTPSNTMTQGQIDKAVANYRALLEKHAKEFDAAAVQTVLGQTELTNKQYAVFRRRVEMFSNLIVCRTKVDRYRTPQAALNATGRMQYTDSEVVNGMPEGEGDEVDVVFFKPKPWEYTRPGFISDAALEKALARRGLKSDPYATIAANEDDFTFADNDPNGAHYKDADGKWCYITFYRWNGERRVHVYRLRNDRYDIGWFSGVRK